MKNLKNNITLKYLTTLLIITLILRLFIPAKTISIIFVVTSLFVVFVMIKKISNIKLKHKIILLILFFALVMRLIFPLAHTFVPDDFWIMEESKNTISTFEPKNCYYTPGLNETCYSFKTTGYPIILSAPFIIFGLNNYVALIFNSLISLSIIFLVYLIVFEFTNNKKRALITSILTTVSLQFLITSNHVDSVIPAIILFLASAFYFLKYYRNDNSLDNLTAISLFLMLIITRIEYSSFILLIIYIYWKKIISNQKNSKHKTSAIISLITVIIITFVVLLSSQNLGSVTLITTGNLGIFSFIDIGNNIAQIINYYGFIKVAIIMAGLIIGLLLTFKNDKRDFLLFFSFIPIIIFYLSFKSPHLKETILLLIIMSYFYISEIICFIDEKMKNNKEYFVRHISKILIIIISLFFIMQALQIKTAIDNNSLLKLDTASLEYLKNNVPENCFIISERPSFVTATSNLKVIRTREIYQQKQTIQKYLDEGKCLVFFQNNFCYKDLDIGPGRDVDARQTMARCSYIRRNYDLEPIGTYKQIDTEYIVYNITGVN